MFKRYYEDELKFLREMGAEFAAAYPNVARELGIGHHDPDVERLLEGVAFLTGRIRQHLDAQFPELLYPLLGHIWPQAMRPTPCTTILEFTPRPNMLRAPELIKAGALVESVPVDRTVCRFRTAFDLPVQPLRVDSLRLESPDPGRHLLRLRMVPLPGVVPSSVNTQPLRFYLHGATSRHEMGQGREAYGLHLWLTQHLVGIRLRSCGGSGADILAERRLHPDVLRPMGWELSESLLPYPTTSCQGYRHLHEFFLFRPKYFFFELPLNTLPCSAETTALEVEFELRRLPDTSLSLNHESIRLNCVPAVNLFEHTASPIRADGTLAEYPVRPEGTMPDHLDIFSITRVFGHTQRQAHPTEYRPFFSFYRPAARVGEQPILYQVYQRPPVAQQRSTGDERPSYAAANTYLAFVEPSGEAAPLSAIVSVDLLATNRDLPLRLRPGEICRLTADIPPTVEVSDLGRVSPPAPAPVGDDGLWRFFAFLQLGLRHVRDREAMCILLQQFNAPARVNQAERQQLESLLEAIAEVQASPRTELVGRPPAVMRGTHVNIALHEERFTHVGEAALLGTALLHFMAEVAPLNTFASLAMKCLDRQFELTWPAMLGKEALL